MTVVHAKANTVATAAANGAAVVNVNGGVAVFTGAAHGAGSGGITTF